VNTEGTNPHSTAMIVSSDVRHHTLRPEQLSELITTVHHAPSHVGQPVETEEVITPAVSVRRSVHHDYVVCSDCGYR
jgi:predicted transcriptional regulator